MNLLSDKTTVSRSLALGAILTLFGVGGLLPACAAQDPGGQAMGAKGAEMAPSDPVAQVGGEKITYADLEKAAAPQLKQLEAQRQKIMEAILSNLVEQKLIDIEAKKRDMTSDDLMNAEVKDKVGEVTDQDVDSWYEENKERVRQPKEQVAEQIKAFLQQQRSGQARTEFLASLKKKYDVKILLEPPREKVEVADAPTRGPANAPVTIVEFSDFECPFCGRITPTLKQVEDTYGSKVRVAFRQFPLSIHPHAQKAAEASLCAKEQGKFWEMHDAMFGDQRNLGVDALKEKAGKIGLDADKFAKCLDSGEVADMVAADMQAGQEAGVTGTPALFINGRLVSGAVPYDQIAQVIDDELSRNGAK